MTGKAIEVVRQLADAVRTAEEALYDATREAAEHGLSVTVTLEEEVAVGGPALVNFPRVVVAIAEVG
jgi:hypothetical protein